ncbi:cysteine proteinase [Patellaria atrata CBS 101060]|uniref:Cysteine proteinase n=1 Tax=Patellaria atrata CBS 101060 TaxID=1346257 RepID=A0A9P4SEQ0_9PEZI|nr:cysteine proteinase [Patellaria atrata CBS 101060]
MNHHTQQDEQIKYDHEEAPLRKHNTRLGNRSQRQRYCSSPVPEIPEIERYSVTHGLGDRWEQPVVYPASGRNRSTVNFDDLLRLDDGEFLNDNIVEFYIRYLVEQNPSTAPNVYFFSTFFYNSLNSNPKGKGGVNYASVKKWTAKDDIFSYDFVIVPVNEDAHWYMAMICNLTNLDRKFKSEDSLEDSCSTTGKTNHPTSIVEESKRDSSPQVIINTRDTTRDSPDLRNRYSQLSLTEVSLADTTNSVDEPQQSKPSEFEKSPDNVDLLDVDTIGRLRNTSVFEAGLNEDMEILGKSEALRSRDKSNVINKGTKRRPPGKRNDPNEPIILLLDSLGAPHAKTAKNLKEYVVLEGQDKRGMEIDTGQLPSMNAQHIPLQDNYCDCGLFLLGYVKKFLKDPREFVTKIIGRHTFSPEEWPDMNPKRMRGEIRDLLFKIEKQQSDQRKVDKQARRSAKKQKVAEQAGNMETGSATEEIQSPKRQSVNRDIELNTPVTGDPKALSGNSHPASPQKTTVLFQSETIR